MDALSGRVLTEGHRLFKELDSWRIDYSAIMGSLALTGDELRSALFEKIPDIAYRRYREHCPHSHDVHTIDWERASYVYDWTWDLMRRGEAPIDTCVDDRMVIASAISKTATAKRSRYRMRRFPTGPVPMYVPGMKDMFDRGHYIAHSLGGMFDLNLFPQLREINRGRSEVGRVFRRMERYGLMHDGIFCFCRPLYYGLADHPAAIEYGVLMENDVLWHNVFPNVHTLKYMRRIDALLVEIRRGKALGDIPAGTFDDESAEPDSDEVE